MYNYAKEKLILFIKETFDINDDKVKHKLQHTFYVVDNAEYLSKKLGLSAEEIELAKLIALFHDFGRFYEARDYQSFREDLHKMDHATLGVKLLFNDNLIKSFIDNRKYDGIMKKAIENHSKYILDTSNMTKDEILHCKIIRDADKLDSFRAKTVSDVYTMANITRKDIEYSVISAKIYNDFMNEKTILSKDRKTGLDIWVSYIAFIFGFYFKESLEVVRNKDYINILVDRFNYKNSVAKIQMEDIRNKANNYIKQNCDK